MGALVMGHRDPMCQRQLAPLTACVFGLLLVFRFDSTATPSAQALAMGQRQVAVLNRSGERLTRPKTLDLDGTILDGTVTHLVWTIWGPSVAIGRGTRASCATGTFTVPQQRPCGTAPTQVTLLHPVDTTDGWLFDQMSYRDETRGRFGRTTTDHLVNDWAPSSLVILPTADDVTGNYLWAGNTGVGSQYLVEWLQIVQDGESVSGRLEATQQKPFNYDDLNVSGVNIHGAVSVAISGYGPNVLGATLVLKFSDGDLLVTGKPSVLFVPASWGSYYVTL